MGSTGSKDERMPVFWADEEDPKGVMDRFRLLLEEIDLEIAWLKDVRTFWEIKADRLKNSYEKPTRRTRTDIAICLAESRRCEGTIRLYEENRRQTVKDFKEILSRYEGDYVGQEWAERFLRDGKGW